MATPQQAARQAARAADASRALRIKEYQRLLQMGPEGLAARAAITAENRAARQSRAASREDQVRPILEAMRANTAATALGDDIPRPRPTADVLPSPASPRQVDVQRPYVVADDRVLRLLDLVNEQGMDALSPEDLIVLEDLQSGLAVRAGSSPAAASAPLDVAGVAIEAPDFNGNLAASGVELDAQPQGGGAANLRPKTAKAATKIQKLANEVNQIAGSERTGEAVAPKQARSTWNKVNSLSSDDFVALVAEMGDEEAALTKLMQVESIAGVATRDPNSIAAAALDRAKQAREGTMRAQGSNAPEFATEAADEVVEPSEFDAQLASLAERVLAKQSRSPGGGLSLEERIVLAGLDPSDPQAARKLPLWLKGRDGRPTAMESRARGERGIESNDIKILRPLLKAREELAAAATPEKQAAALAKVTAAEEALNRKYGTMRRQKGDAFGRPAMSDSRLNKGGQMETFDDLVISIVGARPKAERSLGRSTDAMSAAERRAMGDEAVDVFGEDAFEFMPDEQELDDVADLGETGKPRKVRGRPLPSRQQGAMQTMFSGGQNPIAMMGSPEAVADEILSKQTVFRPGTANYDMARERLAKAIQNEFGGPGPRPATDTPAAVPGPASAMGTSQDPSRLPVRQNTWPDGWMRQTATSGPDAGVNVRVESPTGSPVGEFPALTQPATTDIALVPPQRALPGPKPTASDVNLDASDIEILDEADDVLNEFDRDMPPGARTSGRGQGGRRNGGRGKKEPVIVDAEKVEPVDGLVNADGEVTTTTVATRPQRALPDKSGEKPKADTKPETKADGGGKGPPKDGDTKKLADPDKPIEPKKGKDDVPSRRLRRWLLGGGLVGAGIIGGAALRGGRTAGGGEFIPPLPPGASAGGGGDEPTEADLDRMLERIRGARSGPSTPTYQTLQNWTVWR